MATEKIKAIDIDTGKSIETIGELKKRVSEFKKELDGCTVGSEEAKEAANKLSDAQSKLTAAMKGAVDTSGKIDKSYNGLSAQMKKLKDEYKSTTDAMTQKKLAKEINAINDKLKDMDSNVGVFSRNVGNYQSALEGLGNKGASTLVNGVKGIGSSLKTLYANPMILLVTVLTGIIMGIVKAMSKNEQAVNSIKKALAPLQGIMNVLQNVLTTVTTQLGNISVVLIDKVVGAIKTTLGWVGKVAGKLGLEGVANSVQAITEAMEAQSDVTEKEFELVEKRRKVSEDNARAELELAKLRKQFQEAEGDSAKQAEISAKMSKIQNDIRQRNYNLAKEEYEQIKKANSLTQSTQEDLDKESEAYTKMLQAQAALYEVSKEQKKVIKDTATEIKKEQKEVEKLNKLQQSEVEKLIENLNKWQTGKGNTDFADRRKALETQYKQELELLKNNEDAKKLLTQKYKEDIAKLDKEQNIQAAKELKETLNTILLENSGNIIDTYGATLPEELRGFFGEVMSNLASGEISEEQARNFLSALGFDEDKITELTQSVFKDKLIGTIQQGLTELAEFAGSDESTAPFAKIFGSVNSGIAQIQQGFANAKEATTESGKAFQKWGAIASAAGTVASSALQAVAESQDTSTREGFETAKKANIASATVNGLVGILNAWLSAMSPANAFLTLPGQIAMGATMSTLIGAMMGVQIAQIQKQTYDGGGSSASAVATPSISPALPAIESSATPIVQGASTETEVKDTRVYVVESDITDTQNKVSVTENESKF